MSEMVHRIADVMARLPCRAEAGSELDGLRRREAARAILNAMREPNADMANSGDVLIWQRMIDAALDPPVSVSLPVGET